MADRVSASIAIGGHPPADRLDCFVAIIQSEGLSTDWDGPAFERSALPTGDSLCLMAHEVARGRVEQREACCAANGLAFARWSGAYPGQWGAARTVFTGDGDPKSYAADEDDYILMGRCMAQRLGSHAAIIDHLGGRSV